MGSAKKAKMSEVCGIICDMKREEQGVYEFPRLTLLGFDTNEPQVRRLTQLGLKVSDEDSRHEGVEIERSSPFHLSRILAKEFGYRLLKAVPTEAPGDRTCIMWTLMADGEATEAIGVVADIKRGARESTRSPPRQFLGLNREEIGQLQTQGF